MAKIILNDTEFDFIGYNRNTYFNEDSINSTAYINGLEGTNVMDNLQALGTEIITSIRIVVDDDTIYSLENINAKITAIDESYMGGTTITINLHMEFKN